MKKLLLVILLSLNILVWPVMLRTQFQLYLGPIAKITNSDIEWSRTFLLDCVYFSGHWPYAHTKLATAEFTVIVPRLASAKFCGLYVHYYGKKVIILFPNNFDHEGCYMAMPKLTLAHEMLHQVGLPGHASPKVWATDDIEKTIAACYAERIAKE